MGSRFDLCDAGWKHSVLIKVFHLDVNFLLECVDEVFGDTDYMIVFYLFQRQKNAENVCLLKPTLLDIQTWTCNYCTHKVSKSVWHLRWGRTYTRAVLNADCETTGLLS